MLAACVLASSMAFIDGSALTVALPALRADLDASMATVQWVLNSYMLALAAFVLIGGALADVYGKARILTIGCVAFGVTSALCAVSGTPGQLIAARFLQGASAAIVAPASLALIGAIYPKNLRNQAIGVWAAASALTTAGGPVLGGWLTESYGWEAIFWLNPPLALAAILLLIVARPRDEKSSRAFDLPGAALMAAALALLAWSLSTIGPGEAPGASHETGNTAWAILAGLAGLGLFAAFAVWERRTDHPMTPPRLFKNETFTGLNLATLMLYGALSVMFFLLPFELIDRRGFSPTLSGAAFLPFTLGVGLLSTIVGAQADRLGARRFLIGGAALAGLDYILLILLQSSPFWLSILAPMAVLGLAFAAIVGPLTAGVISSVDAADEGLASGVNNAASRIAQLAGVALAAGLATFEGGYGIALGAAGAASLIGAVIIVRSVN